MAKRRHPPARRPTAASAGPAKTAASKAAPAPTAVRTAERPAATKAAPTPAAPAKAAPDRAAPAKAATGKAAATKPAPAPPRWAVPATLGIAAVGFGASVYLTIEHFTASATLVCPETATISCARVTQSPQSSILGIPLALLGAVYFAAMIGLGVPAAWRSTHPLVRRGRLAAAVVGALAVPYLIFVELFVVDAICLWCTVVHVAAVALLGVVAVATAETSG